jgi:hypothetical protein
MKKILWAAVLLCLTAFGAMAQDVDVDKKTGLVKVDGADAFYLTAKNKTILHNDYSLENLNHEELAYLKYEQDVRYTDRGEKSVGNYRMVFTQTGNHCDLTEFSMITGIIKPIAKSIAAAQLVQNGAISLTEERKFIVLHNGAFAREPIQRKPAAQKDQPVAHAPADISLKGNNIYNESELVGMYKITTDNGISTILVYNGNDVLVCKASHEDGNDNADWNIQSDGKNITILYNSMAPLEKLFKYLVEKNML